MTQMTLEQALQVGLQLHQRGQLKEAESLYRQVLQHAPGLAPAMHLLGMVLAQQGKSDAGIAMIEKAIAAHPHDPSYYNNLGNLYKDRGRLEDAVKVLREAVQRKPDYAMAHSNLGSVLVRLGQVEEAESCFRTAIKLEPKLSGAYLNLGLLLRDRGENVGALEAIQKSVEMEPRDADSHRQLGITLGAAGKMEEAMAALGKALQLRPRDVETEVAIANLRLLQGKMAEAEGALRELVRRFPDNAEVLVSLGNVVILGGRAGEAVELYRRAAELRPDLMPVQNALGNSYLAMGKLEAAGQAFRRALELSPKHPEVLSNLGIVLKQQGDWKGAEALFKEAIERRPESAQALSNLGSLYQVQGRMDEAGEAYMASIQLNPRNVDTLVNLANALKDCGQLDDAIGCYRQAMAIKPNHVDAHSGLIYTMYYHEGYDGQAHFEELKRWYTKHAEGCKREAKPLKNDRSAERRLRVAYLSMDLREHVVARFLLPVLEARDRTRFEICCYADVVAPDAITEKIRSLSDQFTSVAGMPSADIAEMVRRDGIDILVDLGMHTNAERLTVFARRPAPVQVTWLAYAGSTGVEEVDYRLSDPYLDPEGGPTGPYVEKTWRLPETFWCYAASPAAGPVAERVPSESGPVIFGSLNNFAKVSDTALRLWGQLLQRVEGSRLLIHTSQGSHRERLLSILKEMGIDESRCELVGKQSTAAYFQTYDRIDVALDPFPFAGGTTTCDALWMGVPVVTLAGKTAVGRGGVSLLSNVGLPELVAQSPEEYVVIAAQLARDLPRLKELRRTLRERMQKSPVMDAPRFTRAMEGAFREMWKAWCAGKGDGR